MPRGIGRVEGRKSEGRGKDRRKSGWEGDDSLNEWRRKYMRREREGGGFREWKGGGGRRQLK